MFFLKKFLLFLIFFNLILMSFAATQTAPVTGFARSFLTTKPIPNATITVMETGAQYMTDANGFFGPIRYPVGMPITLIFAKSGFITTQSDTTIVTKKGLTEKNNNITFQVPSTYVFLLLKKALGAKENPECCHVVSTVTASLKTLDDLIQGEPGATVKLNPKIPEKPFYFDIFLRGPFKGRTYPFDTGLSRTSADGGIAFFNVPPRDQPYQLIAEKNGVVFSETKFICKKGIFINISPPRGPMVQKPVKI